MSESPPPRRSFVANLRMSVVIVSVAFIYIFGVRSCSERRIVEANRIQRALSQGFVSAVVPRLTDSLDRARARNLVNDILDGLKDGQIGRRDAMALAAHVQAMASQDSVTIQNLDRLQRMVEMILRVNSLADSLKK
ncbi:MAG: hypothetical protein QGH20_08340 [Candidatus Latescibacteria bacterium]|jgi:hypothetical protein|nr:hypothetical protein [Candidatus Latescibacterota bacterium]